MDHEQTMEVSFIVLDQKQQNIFCRISLFWSEELQGQPVYVTATTAVATEMRGGSSGCSLASDETASAADTLKKN